VIAALRDRLEAVRRAELERQRATLGRLDDDGRRAVDDATQALLAKVLHTPTLRLKEAAGTPRGQRLVEALRTLFDL
jgi:glutamyl-tRNA reductase